MNKPIKEIKRILDNLSSENYDEQTVDYLLITYLFQLDSMEEEITLIEMFQKFTESLLTIYIKCMQEEFYEVIPSIKSAQLSQLKYLYTLYQNDEERIEDLEIENKLFHQTIENVIKTYTK